MAKKKEEAKKVVETVKEVDNKELKVVWEAFLERYQEQNPVKYAEKKARGDFDQIPEGFIG